jgi:uncharacterized protein (DUF1800 family)
MAVTWNAVNAAYLLRRAGFGPTAAEVDAFASLGHEAAVARLVDYDAVDNSALEQRLDQIRARLRTLIPEPEDFQKLYVLYYEWVYRMVFTARPLEEKLTLFWHGHFATSYAKVAFADLMRVQNETLRRDASGDFLTMLVDMSGDPAMLFWLDNYLSVREDPNENYARELLELFSLGIGNYTEEDINEIARCFTGWTLRINPAVPGGIEAFFLPSIHDTGAKTVLGQTIRAGQGPEADGRQVCQILAEHPLCADFVAGKLWAFFAGGALPGQVRGRMTAAYFAGNRSIREMLRAMFLSDEFFAPSVTDEQIKSPYELIAGTMRTLEVSPDLFFDSDTVITMLFLSIFEGLVMGQTLFLPPNVKGWDVGRKWINTNTLLARYNFGALLASERQLPLVDPAPLVERSGATTAEEVVDYFLALLGPLDLGSAGRLRLIDYMHAGATGAPGGFTLDQRTVDTKVRGLVKLLLSTAEYQMNLKGRDPGLVAPAVVGLAYKNGKLLLAAEGSNIQRGATVRVTGDAVAGTEAFALAPNAKETKWVVGKRARSSPGGYTLAALVEGGAPLTLVVANPDGGQSEPAALGR